MAPSPAPSSHPASDSTSRRRMSSTSHRSDVSQFQGGEEAFVWGLHRDNGRPWYLEPSRANLDRALVNETITCPVLSCRARLTTVSRARTGGRDGLRHYADGGNHPGETLDHATACAAVEAWLRDAHPQATITREAVSPDGSRRADVLATNDAGQSIAFEIQYSALTADQWKQRHDAYARQGIVDVWLWGHRGHNFHPAGFEQVELTAAQRAVVDAGMPVLFINPETRTVAIAFHLEALLDANGRPSTQRLHSLTVVDRAHLELAELDTLRLTPQRGVTSPRLRELRDSTAEVSRHNDAIRAELAAAEAARATQAAEALSLRKVDVAPQHARIRAMLATIGPRNRWGSSDAHDAIAAHLASDTPSRIDSYLPQPESEPRLIRWQCVLYFEMIAGHASSFTKWDALRTIKAAGVNMNQPNALRLIDDYCDRLTRAGYLTHTRSYKDWPAYAPTTKGAWW